MRCGKGTNWEGGQRVPALVSYPGKISPGKSHTLASTLDIFPTIASIIKNTSGHNNAEIERLLNEDVGYDLTRSLLKDEQVNKCTNIHNYSIKSSLLGSYENYLFPSIFSGSQGNLSLLSGRS